MKGHNTAPLFASFWQAGFEGADHVNGSGQALDLVRASGHLHNLDHDYGALAQFGIRTVRESVGWRLCDRGSDVELNHVLARARAAERHGLQVVWTVCHHGIPRDLDYFSPDLPERFAQFCQRLARRLGPVLDAGAIPATFVPINEISFLTWAVCNTRLMYRDTREDGGDAHALKRNLVRAAVMGTAALRSELPYARFLHVDPLIHVVAPNEDAALVAEARAFSASQFAALDMMCGRLQPELGGNPTLVDAVGVNYYHSNQWELVSERRLHWHVDDPRRRPLPDLLADAAVHCGKPLFIAGTSHVGWGRARWLEHLADDALTAAQRGTAIEGICLYPAVDRPDWQEPNRWHQSGLWDVDASSSTLERRLNPVCARSVLRAQSRLQSDSFSPTEDVPMKTLLVFSHLRWDFVFQRPQQLLSRLAREWRIVFVEEPVLSNDATGAEILVPGNNIEILRLHTRAAVAGFDDTHVPALRRMVLDHLARRGISEYAIWFYTPMALPLLDVLQPSAIVYDCMDELSAFRNAPAHLLQRESHVLEIANVVFTGGPGLYRAKRGKNANTWCFPSSVDAGHFGKARACASADARSDARPQLGFFGVIDERLDLELLEEVSRRRPDWQWYIVGPVVKIDPATLPQAPNLHYLPQQDYAALPALLAAWDVCVLPFARNEATRFISPTKTLEYLAAGKPVVSTAIADVATLYADAVWIAHDAAEFIAHCAAALQPLSNERATAMQAAVERTSWARTAGEMSQLLEAQMHRGLTAEAQMYLSSEYVVPIRARTAAATTQCLVLGAGPTGLSAAYHYGEGSLLVERNTTVGGWCRSIHDSGFQFDHAGHIMFSNDAYVLEMYRLLLGDNIHWQNREAWIYSKNVYTRYPFQGALYGLPTDVLKECLVGAIEAHMGKLALPAAAASGTAANDPSASTVPDDCCGDAVGIGPERGRGHLRERGGKEHDDLAVTGGRSSAATPENFEQFIYRVWGRGVAKHFAIPYNRKLWTLPLSEMETSWLGDRVPLPDLEQMIDGALRPVAKPMGPNARFGYPLKGGFQALMDGFLPHLKGQLALGRTAVRVQPAASTVHFDDGSQVVYENLISTLPLPELIRLIGDEVPPEVRRATAALRHVSIRCVNLGIGRESITDKHWIYYPEDTIFHRIFVQGNASPHCNAPGGFGLTCEISYSAHKPLPLDGDQLIERCIRDCVRVGMIRADDPVWCANQVDMPYAYVVYDHARAENVARIRRWLAERNIILAGRYSEWEYYNSDHAFIAGKRAAESIKAARSDAISRIA